MATLSREKKPLSKEFPALLSEWDFEKNAPLTPDDVTSGSDKKIWWKCAKGHGWNASVNSRTHGAGCPYCAGQRAIKGVNDLATTHPELISEWNYEKNREVSPDSIKAGSNKKVWWKCSHGHEWITSINNRSRSRNCPYCAGKRIIKGETDLGTVCPDIVKEWDYGKNGERKPDDFSVGSKEKVWWICSTCGNQWEATISSRALNGCGCPVCGRKKQAKSFREGIIREKGSLLVTHPEICIEWNYKRNKNSPEDYSYGSNEKVWWLCKKGHEWKATIASRTSGCGCPRCNEGHRVSLPEKAIVFYLMQSGIDVKENARIFGDSLRDVDIYIHSRNCAIEYDGERWHKNKEKDIEKTHLCKDQGIKLIRIREPKIGKLNDGYSLECITGEPKNDLSYINNAVLWLIDTLELKQIPVDANKDMPQIRAMIEQSYEDDSFGHIYPELALEWDYQKNGNLLPIDLSKCSGIKVWWTCSENHSWQDSIAHRVYGRSCPVCAGKRTQSGYNDLQTRFPSIAAEWDYEKNGNLDPRYISDCNAQKVWWRCPKGHSYLASVAHRTSDSSTSCPYCANQKVLVGYNDLLSQDPKVSEEWNYNKNGVLKPENIIVTSNKRVWWKCSTCGYEWRACLSSRTRTKVGCPKCGAKKGGVQHRRSAVKSNGSVLERYPELAKEWDCEKNGTNKPTDFSPGSSFPIWWRCLTCGNSWQSRISNRTILGRGCPECAVKNRTRKKNKAVVCVEKSATFNSISEASDKTGVNASKISACCKGKQQTAGGYHWKYANS